MILVKHWIINITIILFSIFFSYQCIVKKKYSKYTTKTKRETQEESTAKDQKIRGRQQQRTTGIPWPQTTAGLVCLVALSLRSFNPASRRPLCTITHPYSHGHNLMGRSYTFCSPIFHAILKLQLFLGDSTFSITYQHTQTHAQTQ